MFILGIGDVSRAGANSSTPSNEVRRQQQQRTADARRADTQRTANTGQAEGATPTGQTPPPQPQQLSPYERAIYKTMQVGIEAAGKYTEQLYVDGQEHARNTSPQVITVASSATPRAATEASKRVASAGVVANIKSNFPHLDQDAVETAGKIVEAFMEGFIA